MADGGARRATSREGRSRAWGWRLWGLGVAALGLLALALGDFSAGQSVPRSLPERQALAYAADGLMLVAGIALSWRRTATWASAALCAYYVLVVVLLMEGRTVWRHAGELMAYTNAAHQVAMASAALIVLAGRIRGPSAWPDLLIRAGRTGFGLSAILFGVAHFAFMGLTAPLVPAWLPPSGTFWGYATGVADIAAGLAILSGILARPAAILLTAMFGLFMPLVHLPRLVAAPSDAFAWTETVTTLALTAAAWVVADLARGAWPARPATEPCDFG